MTPRKREIAVLFIVHMWPRNHSAKRLSGPNVPGSSLALQIGEIVGSPPPIAKPILPIFREESSSFIPLQAESNRKNQVSSPL
jgi:hypothetical protein